MQWVAWFESVPLGRTPPHTLLQARREEHSCTEPSSSPEPIKEWKNVQSPKTHRPEARLRPRLQMSNRRDRSANTRQMTLLYWGKFKAQARPVFKLLMLGILLLSTCFSWKRHLSGKLYVCLRRSKVMKAPSLNRWPKGGYSSLSPCMKTKCIFIDFEHGVVPDWC